MGNTKGKAKVYHTEGGEHGESSIGAALRQAAQKAGTDVGSIGGPPSPEQMAAMATRMIEETTQFLKSPEEIAADREKARQARLAERERIAQIVSALSAIPEGTKKGVLRALQSEYLLGSRPDRSLGDEERRTLQVAKNVLEKTYKSWPQQIQRLFQNGFPLKQEVEAKVAELETRKAEATDPDVADQIEADLERARADLVISVESEELHQGFNAWKMAQEKAAEAARQNARHERQDAIDVFKKGTVDIDVAIANGAGEFCVWVRYVFQYRGDNRQLVPVIDDTTGKPVERTGFVKFRVVGRSGSICAKLDERRPPHIQVDPDRLIELNPEQEFNTPNGQPRWHEEVRVALVKAYAESRAKTLKEEERAELGLFLFGIESQGTITVSEIFDAMSGGKGRKTGVIAINNPYLRLNPRDRGSKQFHLAFTLKVGAKGVCHLGEQFYSSEPSVDLTPLLGRELELEVGKDSLLHLYDPNLPSDDGLEGAELETAKQARSAITRACGRAFGALLAQKRYETSQASTAATPREEGTAEQQEPEVVPAAV